MAGTAPAEVQVRLQLVIRPALATHPVNRRCAVHNTRPPHHLLHFVTRRCSYFFLTITYACHALCSSQNSDLESMLVSPAVDSATAEDAGLIPVSGPDQHDRDPDDGSPPGRRAHRADVHLAVEPRALPSTSRATAWPAMLYAAV